MIFCFIQDRDRDLGVASVARVRLCQMARKDRGARTGSLRDTFVQKRLHCGRGGCGERGCSQPRWRWPGYGKAGVWLFITLSSDLVVFSFPSLAQIPGECLPT